MKCHGVYMYFLVVSARFGYRKLAESGSNFLKTAVFRNMRFPGCFFVTDGRIDMGVGANHTSWRIDVPFGSFSQIWLPGIG